MHLPNRMKKIKQAAERNRFAAVLRIGFFDTEINVISREKSAKSRMNPVQMA